MRSHHARASRPRLALSVYVRARALCSMPSALRTSSLSLPASSPQPLQLEQALALPRSQSQSRPLAHVRGVLQPWSHRPGCPTSPCRCFASPTPALAMASGSQRNRLQRCKHAFHVNCHRDTAGMIPRPPLGPGPKRLRPPRPVRPQRQLLH